MKTVSGRDIEPFKKGEERVRRTEQIEITIDPKGLETQRNATFLK